MKLHKLISTVDMSHEEWLRYRKLGIGGSDAGSICGLNRTALQSLSSRIRRRKKQGKKKTMRQ